MQRMQRDEGFGLIELIFIFAIVLLVVFAGYFVLANRHNQLNSSSTTTNQSRAVIMIVGYSGGLCADGNECSGINKLYSDGKFENRTDVNKKELAELNKIIESTNFTNYPKNPYPHCPSASDGSDEFLEFPQKYPDKSFKLCELQIPPNDPAITYINNLIDNHTKN